MRHPILLSLLTAGFLACAAMGRAAPIVIDRLGTIDAAYDGERGVIYFTTFGQGDVARYDVATGSFLEPIHVGGQPWGLALSQDQDTLLVADKTRASNGKVQVQVVDLPSDSLHPIQFEPDGIESGIASVGFAGPDHFLASGYFAGSGSIPLRYVDLTTGSHTSIGEVENFSYLVNSLDMNSVAILQSGSTAELYDATTGALTHRFTDQAFQAAISADGARIAVMTTFGAQIYDRQFHLLGTIGGLVDYQEVVPISAAFSSDGTKLYLSWAGSSEIYQVWDVATLQKLETLYEDPTIAYGVDAAVGIKDPFLRLSPDGGTLVAIEPYAVRLFDVPEPGELAAICLGFAAAILARRRRSSGVVGGFATEIVARSQRSTTIIAAWRSKASST